MPIVFDITTDELYLQGLERGEERGFEKGEERGLEKGLEKGLERGIRLELKRGDMTLKEISDYFEVTIDFVIKIKVKMEKESR